MTFKPFRALLLGVALLGLTSAALGQQEIRIGAAHFPPYTVRPEKGEDTGLLPELVQALNNAQQQYRFVLVPTSIPRRFQDFRQGRTDMAIFENPDWGWEGLAYTSVDMGLEDAEVFVARKAPGRDESYFTDLAGKRLALFSGYHYAFANFDADPEFLARQYQATLTYSHDSNLMMVLRNRADIALVTRSYLSDFLARNADVAGEFLTSERIDQIYHHFALIRPGAPIDGRQFGQLLKQLAESGELARIFNPYRIAVLGYPVGPQVVQHSVP
ncbi:MULTISPECIES: ABC transporter substrate-binding protein [unclassified Pseudomonas]|uniref:substrate-binding periplasmic protein n=1 Tax=unclassified Pseudomonas TaxID=196821 RepID=UPI000BD378D8|nr:ABC-type amino acid transport substrate-binding protein [Pseudomonas sp. URIL14HWK12:I12]PVZ24153.1 ABC-type amino acid transport substrate-binding protein [Pseudomonas sp. URIL14HWK12:I10]PVZ33208.1 ABC-type amino acid transport substrate-binding protein [Pseudomonas sp. URIL14HWK12:I11]SNZ10734.1 amino acid ABC transporter substrate-binding protein, PAAT family (TC 3.A.1.3.-) [Pseudomonas sp. URIL14HWK12:I9]